MELKNIDQDFNLLLFKCIEGSASESEMKEAWDWIKHHETNRMYYENMRDIWLSVSNSKPFEANQLEYFWQKFRNRNNIRFINENRNIINEPKRLLPGLLRIAAIIIVTFVLGALIGKYYLSPDAIDQSKEYYIVEAPRGAKSLITLADGTKVWLNAGSKVSYNLNYNQKNRDIYLEGEAFFEVSKNKEIPFYVHSAGIVIKAIGTAFNVKAYPEEGIVETTLVEGSVSIESIDKSGKKEQLLMQPNQKASFYKATKEVIVEDKSKLEEEEDITPIPIKAKIDRVELKKEIDTELYTSWKDKRWVFEKQTLEDFAVILERMYDVRVSFKNEELKNYRLSGSFEEENLEQVLKAIQYTVPLEYNIEHNEVTFRINPKVKSRYEKLLNRK